MTKNKHIDGMTLCTTIPEDLIRSVKSLAQEESVRISDVVTEAVTDLLVKYKTAGPDRGGNEEFNNARV